jgi:hypothetical protein
MKIEVDWFVQMLNLDLFSLGLELEQMPQLLHELCGEIEEMSVTHSL